MVWHNTVYVECEICAHQYLPPLTAGRTVGELIGHLVSQGWRAGFTKDLYPGLPGPYMKTSLDFCPDCKDKPYEVEIDQMQVEIDRAFVEGRHEDMMKLFKERDERDRGY
jgi:hypothetical protein